MLKSSSNPLSGATREVKELIAAIEAGALPVGRQFKLEAAGGTRKGVLVRVWVGSKWIYVFLAQEFNSPRILNGLSTDYFRKNGRSP